jgi:DNA-binding transcriptional MerR regulator
VHAHLRIGAVARRTGVSTDLLRAWERRYGLLRPIRTDGGFRLYTEDDVSRVEAMRDHLARGLSAAQAAEVALAAPPAGAAVVDRPAAALVDRLERFDEDGTDALLDTLLASLTLTSVLRDAILPALQTLGDRWRRGEVTVAQEHFASALLRGRLLGLARGWGGGAGPHALLACPPGELHDLGLIAFGLALRGEGWRVTYLGTDTPVETIGGAADAVDADVVVVAATLPEHIDAVRVALAALAAARRLVLAGPGATPDAAGAIGAEHLDGDPVAVAALVAGRPEPRPPASD